MKIFQQTLLAFLFLKSAFSQTVVDIAVDDGRFTTLVQLLTNADLVDALSGEGPFTVFAPVDDAFSAVPAKFLEPMYSEHLKNILLYHVVAGAEVFSTDLTLDMEAETMNSEKITVNSVDPVQVNGVDVIIPDVDATNGVIHVVDEVLLPNAATKSIVDLAVATPELSTLVNLLTAADLVETLSGEGPFTVFAPVNDAFAELPADDLAALQDPANKQALIDILTFHVVSGDIVLSTDLASSENVAVKSASMSTPPSLDTSIVTTADILANNGVVHIIDAVLIPAAEDKQVDTETEDSSGVLSWSVMMIAQASVALSAFLTL